MANSTACHPEKDGRNGIDANGYYPLTREREERTRLPTFSDSSRFEIDARSERFFNVSETGSDTRTLETTTKENDEDE